MDVLLLHILPTILGKSNCHIFMAWKNTGSLASWTMFCRTLQQSCLKLRKPTRSLPVCLLVWNTNFTILSQFLAKQHITVHEAMQSFEMRFQWWERYSCICDVAILYEVIGDGGHTAPCFTSALDRGVVRFTPCPLYSLEQVWMLWGRLKDISWHKDNHTAASETGHYVKSCTCVLQKKQKSCD